MQWLILLGAVFVAAIFIVRYLAYKSMTHKVCSLDPDNEYCRKHYKKNLDINNDPYTKCDVVYGETPHGGVKTVICYIDNYNNMTSKQKAVKVMVRELDKNNRAVYETWTPMEAEKSSG